MPERVPRLTSVGDAIRTEGLGWVWRRLRWRTPATGPGRVVHAGLRQALGAALAPGRWFRPNPVRAAVSDDTLCAFFDLQVAPVTYDASWFAAAADLTRRRLGLARVHFVVVPGNTDGVREERAAYEAVVDVASRLWRLHSVVVPIFTLVPASAGYTVLPSRRAAAHLRAAAGGRVYPKHYEPALPVGHHPSELLTAGRRAEARIGVLRGPVQGHRFVERWLSPRLRGRKAITITLRDYAFMPERNSNLGVWLAFARRLDPTKYLPVVVLDTERTLDLPPAALEAFEVFREASWSVPLRMALYERSYLNLGVNCGPLFMAVLNERARVLIFKIITPSVPQTTEAFMQGLGFEIGGQLPFATEFQRLVWEDDTVDTIQREFDAMVARIEAGEPRGTLEIGGGVSTSGTED